ncbi:hypothetical protein [Streptosporangium minutum]|uniref:Uncharacterized protein n=1 Tax=Streptosporangium minutum TaxID=569862 RepID=A0A243RVT3_9ACTN|nr:hypothetical protein [Streptosporangium minutum]OUC99296.1 hypothetical protein CA984_03560 [Streptosporangium minutum]
MQQNLPASMPCPPWCKAEHTDADPDRTHAAVLGPFGGPGQVVIRYVQADTDGTRYPALGRLSYYVGEQRRVRDLEPTDAYDWGQVIAGLDIRSFTEFAEALGTAARVLDGGL